MYFSALLALSRENNFRWHVTPSKLGGVWGSLYVCAPTHIQCKTPSQRHREKGRLGKDFLKIIRGPYVISGLL
jgi:hypothetical protein